MITLSSKIKRANFDSSYLLFQEYFELAKQENNPALLSGLRSYDNKCPLFIALDNFYSKSNNSKDNIELGVKYWSTTPIARLQSSNILSIIKNQLNKGFDDRLFFTILDIGSGDGQLILDIARMIQSNFGIKKIKIILIEENIKLLEKCKDLFRDYECDDFLVEIICASILDVDFDTFSNKAPISLVHISSMLHELTYVNKLNILNKLKKVSNAICLTELEGAHDITRSLDKPLILSAYKFYKELLEICKPTRLNTGFENFERFIVNEFVDIIFNEYPKRRNYHLELDDWIKIYEKCGLKNITRSYSYQFSGLRSFTSFLYI